MSRLKKNNKWKKNDIVKCSLCDYFAQFEGADEPICANNQRMVDDPSIKHPNAGRICKFYFPNYTFPEEEEK